MNFIPFCCVGEFEFERTILDYPILRLNWIFEPADEFCKEYYHRPDGGVILAVRHQIIESIFCYDEIVFNGVNLIGLTISELQILMNTQYVGTVDVLDFEDDGYPQSVYDFDEVGLQVWEKQGKVITIIAGGKNNYSTLPFYE